MATFNFFDSFHVEMYAGTHDACLSADTDTLKIYLSNTTPSASTHTIKSELAEISTGNGYTGAVDISNAFTLSGGITSVAGTDVTVTASGGAIATFRYIVLFNDTPAGPVDPLVGWWDYGSAVDLADTQAFSTVLDTTMFRVVTP